MTDHITFEPDSITIRTNDRALYELLSNNEYLTAFDRQWRSIAGQYIGPDQYQVTLQQAEPFHSPQFSNPSTVEQQQTNMNKVKEFTLWAGNLSEDDFMKLPYGVAIALLQLLVQQRIYRIKDERKAFFAKRANKAKRQTPPAG